MVPGTGFEPARLVGIGLIQGAETKRIDSAT
jgi:hypothetical protein